MAGSSISSWFENVAKNTGLQSGVSSGFQGGTSTFQTGWVDNGSNNSDDDSGGSGGYGYGYGGGYGGGGGGKSAEETQAETQAQIDNTAGNYGKRGKDISDLGVQTLNNIKDQINQNNALYKQTQRNNMMQVEWQPQQQKTQSAVAAVRNRMGNSANGSALVDLAEGAGRVDDMSDVQLIGAWKQNENAARNDWFQANEDLISDYLDQVVSVKDELSKLYSQYWAAMSNIHSQLASGENMEKSARGESSTFGEGTDKYDLPGAEGVTASSALQALYKIPERGSAVNQATYDYLRPSQSETSTRVNENAGTAVRSSQANRAFVDNINAYRRRV